MIKLWIIVVLNKLRRDYKPINGQILIWSNPDTATGGRATAAAAAEGENFLFSHLHRDHGGFSARQCVVSPRAGNEGPRSFHNQGEGLY